MEKKKDGTDMPHFYAFLFMRVLQMCNISAVYFLLTIFNIIYSEVIAGRIEFIEIGFCNGGSTSFPQNPSSFNQYLFINAFKRQILEQVC